MSGVDFELHIALRTGGGEINKRFSKYFLYEVVKYVSY